MRYPFWRGNCWKMRYTIDFLGNVNMRILLVEDDGMIAQAVMMGLKHANYAVDWVQDV